MTPEMIYTSLVVLAVLAALASNRVPAEVTMMAALVAVLVGDVITVDQALAGFANPGLITVAVLYVVAAALRDTGAIYWVAHKLLGQPKSALGSQSRLILPTSILSAFLNNTTVVAMMIRNGLPMPYPPVFNVAKFERASQDGFFLCIESADPLFDVEGTTSFLQDLNPVEVSTVEW